MSLGMGNNIDPPYSQLPVTGLPLPNNSLQIGKGKEGRRKRGKELARGVRESAVWRGTTKSLEKEGPIFLLAYV